ncbi:MAG TPA: 2-amino-4-hydroxy-6-hydroxymethyldihydropteridine diphosphokinase [Nakamurella multipartita]|nr:2-amino-4-hydroxy-6-hydroxymethyldihydropteridine diphosphokinase [Nakamurella multipartita]
MSRAVLSLGSNVGDRTAHLQTAVNSLGRTVRTVSSIYRTPPWGGVPQPDYYNLVVIAEDDGNDAHAWWDRCQALEREAGRERTIRWGPRTLDADVIVVEVHGHSVISDEPELTLPHPRAAQRAFVLRPWAEIDPTAELPGAGAIADLLDGLDTSAIVRVGHVH